MHSLTPSVPGPLTEIEKIRSDTINAILLLEERCGPAVMGSLSEKELLTRLNAHLGRLKEASRRADTSYKKALRFGTDHILDSIEARTCAVLRVVARELQKSDFVGASVITRILRRIDQLSVWRPLKEPVRVHWRAKSGKGFRPIVALGPMRKAQQLLLRDILSVIGIDSPFDVTRKGGGGERRLAQSVCKD